MSSHQPHSNQPSTRMRLQSLLSLLSLLQIRQALGDARAPEELIGKGVRFVERIYRLRIFGLSIGFFCVTAAFQQNPAPWPLWVLLCFHGYLWPHVAYVVALKNSIPYRAERRNLVIDTVFGGFWVIAMQGNLVPSTVILAMLLMDNIAAGGLKLLLRGLIGSIMGALLGLLLLDFHFQPLSDLYTIIACLPMLALYPLALGGGIHRGLHHRVFFCQSQPGHDQRDARLVQRSGGGGGAVTGGLLFRHAIAVPCALGFA